MFLSYTRIAFVSKPTITSKKWQSFYRYMQKNWVFYLLLLPAVIDVLIFCYFPMYGIQIGFRRYKVVDGISGSKWVGLKYFKQFVEMPDFWRLIKNTVSLSGYCLLFGFPLPIILALLLNDQQNRTVKRATQMLTYMPHFISTVAVVGILSFLTDSNAGVLNIIRNRLGLAQFNYQGSSAAFRPMYVISHVWQHTGWNAIMFLAALSSVSIDTLEAARIDGASRIQTNWYINIPAILPTVIVMLVLSTGSLLSVGFEKVYLMQNSLILDVSETISTYTYKMGIQKGQFSYTTAIGLFNNIANAIILVIVNIIARNISGFSLW